ncbi:acyltransferase family protein [Parasediminibacterium sp. JCM 36343]|uniref:acyltransferase family protein n=1 Tax=Parasediminibacterium sp. JCM 36343 TaxID=3374279 RepID=UPI00397D6406
MISNKIVSIQILRAIACLSVLYVHFYVDFPVTGHIFCGAIGVDLFFVISGYIIASSIDKYVFESNRGLSFLINRFSRVAPYYYLLTFLFACFLYIFHKHISTVRLIKSLLFLPQREDPILFLGWSLNHEVFFYAVIGCFLLLFKKIKAKYAGLGFMATIFCIYLIPSKNYLILFFQSNLNLIFLFGYFGYVYKGLLQKYFNHYIILVLSISSFFIIPFFTTDFPVVQGQTSITPTWVYSREWIYICKYSFFLPRCIAWGLPSFALLMSLVAQEATLKQFSNSVLVKIGDYSYSVYLLEAFLWLIKFVKGIPTTLLYSSGLCVIVLLISYYMFKVETFLGKSFKNYLLKIVIK